MKSGDHVPRLVRIAGVRIRLVVGEQEVSSQTLESIGIMNVRSPNEAKKDSPLEWLR